MPIIMGTKLKLLLIDSGYERNELNESINIDVLLNAIDEDILSQLSFDVVYCKIDEISNNDTIIENPQTYDSVFISTKITAYSYFQKVHSIFTDTPIFAGGVLATYINNELAKKYKDTILLLGEGETNFSSILRILLNLKSESKLIIPEIKQYLKKSNVDNICFWDDQDCCVFISNRAVINLERTDRPPVHRTLSRLLAYNGLVRMETSRGCPWNRCSFCVMPWRYTNTRWRSFSMKKIENELEYLASQGAKQILFTDEDFVGNKRHILELCQLFTKLNSGQNQISFGGSTSVYTLLKLGEDIDTILELMYNSGITTIFIGIESGSQSQLNRYRKGVTVEQNINIIKKLQKYPWVIDIGFIMFDAETTMHEVEENMLFISKCNLQQNMSHFAKKLRVVPHTKMYEDYKSKGYLHSDINFNEMYYDYNFLDSNINVLLHYLEEIDSLIAEKTYALQAKLRGSTDFKQKLKIEKEISSIRSIEYTFLNNCIAEYHNSGVLSMDLADYYYHTIRKKVL